MNILSKKTALTLLILLGTMGTSYPKTTTIIVSFNTLFRPDAQLIREYIQSTLTIRNYLSLLLKGIPSPEETKSLLFTFLATVPTIHTLLPNPTWISDYPSYETAGYKFPPIFCQMIVSKTLQHEEAILKQILSSLHNYASIQSETRKKILKATIETLFQSKLMNKFVNPINPMLHLFQKLKESYRLILIGNIPGYAWQDMLNRPKTQPLLQLFPTTHRYVSGERQLLKTAPEMYRLILDDHGLKPQECLIIDSTALNLEYPLQLEMTTIAFDPNKDTISQFKQNLETILNH
jgi:FMN phosphatase YigB (HAD superfamily)